MYDLYELIPGLRDAVLDNMGCSDWDTSSAYDKYADEIKTSAEEEFYEF